MTTKGAITEHAPAKINLSLHVTGQREDGYHLLDSLVMFTAIGDMITISPADTLTLTIDGPFADRLTADRDNLVLGAARSFGTDKGAAITLTKNLPVASGIGGGSADAAATLRALSRLWNLPISDLHTQLALGADVPVCMTPDLSRMEGIGDQITRISAMSDTNLILINPGVGVSTATVFNALSSKQNPKMNDPMPTETDRNDWLSWLSVQRNDLERPACAAHPVIADVLKAMRAQRGCQLARMSGSGATCFAIFEGPKTAQDAAQSIRAAHPDWWVCNTTEAKSI